MNEVTTEAPASIRDEASGKWVRDRMAELELSVGSLAEQLAKHGDDRPAATVLRSVQRMRSGAMRPTGEMKAFLGLLAAARNGLIAVRNDR